MNSSLKWISSDGGPYILATKSTALKWLGIEGSSTLNNFCLNDYQRACQVSDFVGKISGNPHEILVSADLPNEVTWMMRAKNNGLLVKWIGADSDQQILDALKKLDCDSFKALPFYFQVSETEMCLFDSAYKFDESADNHLNITLEPGCYEISVLNYEPNKNVWLQLIQLKQSLPSMPLSGSVEPNVQ